MHGSFSGTPAHDHGLIHFLSNGAGITIRQACIKTKKVRGWIHPHKWTIVILAYLDFNFCDWMVMQHVCHLALWRNVFLCKNCHNHILCVSYVRLDCKLIGTRYCFSYLPDGDHAWNNLRIFFLQLSTMWHPELCWEKADVFRRWFSTKTSDW